MAVSMDDHGIFDATIGEKIARDRDPDPETSTPDDARDLACPGLGPLEGTRVQIAGLFGGGLHSTSGDGWSIDVVSPDWPNEQVLLSKNGGNFSSEPATDWWHIFHSTLHTAGFSPSGRTLVVATSSDLTLWTRPNATR
jgi:hypothetical protein